MLGVVIGVATVMAMASIVQGIRDQIINTIEVAGPTTFYVVRFFSQTPLNPDALPKEVRIRPVMKPEEAEAHRPPARHALRRHLGAAVPAHGRTRARAPRS